MSRGYRSEDAGDDREPVEIGYSLPVQETAAALRVRIDGMDRWIPKSLIVEHHEEACLLMVPEWFAKKEGLI